MNYVSNFFLLFIIFNFSRCIRVPNVSQKSFLYYKSDSNIDASAIKITVTDSIIKNSKLLKIKVENLSTYDTFFVPIKWGCRNSVGLIDFSDFDNPNPKEYNLLNDTLHFYHRSSFHNGSAYFIRINPHKYYQFQLNYLDCETTLMEYKDYQKKKKYLHKLKYAITIAYLNTDDFDEYQYKKIRPYFYPDTIIVNSLIPIKSIEVRNY
jgi:hypothetical protein